MGPRCHDRYFLRIANRLVTEWNDWHMPRLSRSHTNTHTRAHTHTHTHTHHTPHTHNTHTQTAHQKILSLVPRRTPTQTPPARRHIHTHSYVRVHARTHTHTHTHSRKLKSTDRWQGSSICRWTFPKLRAWCWYQSAALRATFPRIEAPNGTWKVKQKDQTGALVKEDGKTMLFLYLDWKSVSSRFVWE